MTQIEGYVSTTAESPLALFLEKHDLSELHSKFVNSGYELKHLKICNENDLREICQSLEINTNHRLKLLIAIKELQNEKIIEPQFDKLNVTTQQREKLRLLKQKYDKITVIIQKLDNVKQQQLLKNKQNFDEINELINGKFNVFTQKLDKYLLDTKKLQLKYKEIENNVREIVENSSDNANKNSEKQSSNSIFSFFGKNSKKSEKKQKDIKIDSILNNIPTLNEKLYDISNEQLILNNFLQNTVYYIKNYTPKKEEKEENDLFEENKKLKEKLFDLEQELSQYKYGKKFNNFMFTPKKKETTKVDTSFGIEKEEKKFFFIPSKKGNNNDLLFISSNKLCIKNDNNNYIVVPFNNTFDCLSNETNREYKIVFNQYGNPYGTSMFGLIQPHFNTYDRYFSNSKGLIVSSGMHNKLFISINSYYDKNRMFDYFNGKEIIKCKISERAFPNLISWNAREFIGIKPHFVSIIVNVSKNEVRIMNENTKHFLIIDQIRSIKNVRLACNIFNSGVQIVKQGFC